MYEASLFCHVVPDLQEKRAMYINFNWNFEFCGDYDYIMIFIIIFPN